MLLIVEEEIIKTLTIEQLNEILRLHKLWLEGDRAGVRANLRGANLKGADLKGADLRRADLQRANLEEADLEGANLKETNLQWANLKGANLKEANLRGADLEEVNLQETNLRGADLQGADLRQADLQEADLEGANLDYSCWPLHCGNKNVKLDKKLQAQLLGHIVDACKDVQFTEEQLDFVYENWERAKEFLGERE